MEKQRARRKAGSRPLPKPPPPMSEADFARLGDGVFAYVRLMTSEEAKMRFPTVKGLPRGITLFALYSASGTPIALTDTRSAIQVHADSDDLEIATVH